MPDTEDRPVSVHDTEVPPGIRQAVLELMQPGDQLWRCPRMSAPSGLFGFGKRHVHIEWWLESADGQLIEAFWET